MDSKSFPVLILTKAEQPGNLNGGLVVVTVNKPPVLYSDLLAAPESDRLDDAGWREADPHVGLWPSQDLADDLAHLANVVD